MSDQPRRIYPIDQLEMLTYLAIARALTEVVPIEKLLLSTGKLAELAGRLGHVSHRPLETQLERARLTAHRASRLVPGAQCLQRALASRVWLARRGVASEVIVGFRMSGELEGHAWLEIRDGSLSRDLFREDNSGYRESFRESEVVERAA